MNNAERLENDRQAIRTLARVRRLMNAYANLYSIRNSTFTSAAVAQVLDRDMLAVAHKVVFELNRYADIRNSLATTNDETDLA